MIDEGRWQKRYEQLSEDYDKLEKAQKDAEKNFRRALKNLITSLKDSHQSLDFQVRRLEIQLDTEVDNKEIYHTSQAIADLKASLNPEPNHEMKEALHSLIAFAYTLPKSEKIRSEVKAIEKKINETDASSLPELLKSLSNILVKTLALSETNNLYLPWYKKWFPFLKGDQHIDLDPLINILNYLLNHLHVPNHLEEELDSIRVMIEDDSENNILKALELTSQLILKIHQANELQFNRFLEKIHTHISDIETLLFQQEKTQSIQNTSTMDLEKTFSVKLKNLSEDVHTSQSIETVKTHVINNLDQMMTHIKQYTSKQTELYHESQIEIQSLNEQIREAELVTNDLIDELSKVSLESLRDPLTELPNRASYDRRIASDYARWKRFNHHFIMILCDLDKFKRINDTYGHKAGDKVLYQAARVFKNSLRKIDFVGRYGGEEFIILLEKIDIEQAKKVCEKIREAIATIGFHFNNEPVKITASFGIAAFQGNDNIDDVFERADKALYHSKKNGRNQMTLL